MAARDAKDIPAVSVSGYPEPFRSKVLPREVRRLGDAFGLTQIGASLVTMLPGKESSMRHTHTHEDELIYMLDGSSCFGRTRARSRFAREWSSGSPRGTASRTTW
jgi:uncharacterized cupin superfamily protein